MVTKLKEKFRVKGSILVLVLVILLVAALLLIFTMNQLASYIQQTTTEKQEKVTDVFAKSALDILTKRIIENPNLYTADVNVSLQSLTVCSPNASDADKRCDANSRVHVKVLPYIFAYKLGHDQTIQATLADSTVRSTAVTPSSIELIFTPQVEDTLPDRLLVTGYYYNNGLRVLGTCVITFTNTTITRGACLGPLSAVRLSIDNTRPEYGRLRIRISATGANRAHFYRIKLLASNVQESVNISVTGPGYGNLNKVQEILLQANVLSVEADNKVSTKLIRAILMSRMMPEVFDWVLFNGSGGSIQK